MSAASGMRARMESLELLANNLANVETGGFKADREFYSLYSSADAGADARNGQVTTLPVIQSQWTDLRQGDLKTTGNPLDVAIEGEGYLTVQTPAGDRYTRNGALQINAQGQLVNNQGMPVVGDNGPIVFQPGDRNVIISKDGRVSVNEGANDKTEGVRGKLRLVSFAQPQNLLKDGANTFATPAGMTPQPVANAKFQQGNIEKSNVNGVIEMTRMIEITRTYTQMSTLLQQQGDLRKNSIQQLAEVPA